MKKRIISIVTTMALLFNMSVNAKAATSLEEKYKQAYDMTVNVIETAKKYGVKPYYKYGSSEVTNVVNAVELGDLQRKILETRKSIDLLPSSLQEIKNTLSEMLDNFQHPIYESIVKTITQSNDLLKNNIMNINKDSNMMLKISIPGLACLDVLFGKCLIKDVPEPFKSTYSSALDVNKQKILNWYVELVDFAEKTKNDNIKNFLLKIFEVESKYSNGSADIINFINSLTNRVNKIQTIPTLNKDDITKYALENGFMEVTNLDSLPELILKSVKKDASFKQIFSKKEGANTLFYIVKGNGVELCSQESTLTGAENFIKKIVATDEQIVYNILESGSNCGFLTKNGQLCFCVYDDEIKYYVIIFDCLYK